MPQKLFRSITALDWDSKPVRRGMSLLIGLAILLVVVPSALRQQSFNAIVNTRFVAMHSPIEGVVHHFGKEPGDPVVATEVLADIINPRLNESFLRELQVENQSLQARIEGFERHLLRLQALRQDLQRRLALNRRFETARQLEELNEGQADIQTQQAALTEQQALLRRQESLRQQGFVSPQYVDSTQSAVQTNAARMAAAQARYARMEVEREALQQQVFLGNGRNDVPYTQQRLDEVTILISDLQMRMGEQKRRVAAIAQQMAVERDRLALNRQAAISSPLNGLIWKKFFANGSEVVIGAELVQVIDCKGLFLDVEVTEDSLDSMAAGTSVRYRFRGSQEWHNGQVVAKAGSGNTLQDRTLAAVLQVAKGAARVVVSIDPRDLEASQDNLCHVGRQVEVSMPRAWTTSVWITRITGLF